MNKIVIYRFGEHAGFWLNGDFMAGGCYTEGVDPDLIESIARNAAHTMNESVTGGCKLQVIQDEPPQDPEWQWDDLEDRLPLTE